MNTSKLRIAILGLHYAPESTGNAPYTTGLAEGLAARGHAVRVITGYPHYPDWKVNPEYGGWVLRESVNGVEVTRLRHFVPKLPTALNRLHMELSFGLRLICSRWGDPDVVILVSPALFSTGLALGRARILSKRTRTVVWVQDLYSRGLAETGEGSNRAVRFAALTESLIFRSANGVVAIHERFAKYIEETLAVKKSRIGVVRNWTHLPEAPKLDRSFTRQHLGWGEDEIIVLHAGNMGKKQGLENVLAAGRLAEKSKSPVRFVLLGNGNQRSSLEAAAFGLQKVSFLDALPDLEFQAALHAADVLLVNELPGVRDMSVPSKLTSYFSTGVPVLAATDVASVTGEELNASGAGIRVDPGQPDALLAGAERLGSDRSLAASVGRNGIRFRNETLSEAAAMAKYDDLITSLALSRGR